MGRTGKAMLLSGLVIPGLGQWTLGRRGLSVSIMAATLAVAGAMFIRIWSLLNETISATGNPFDLFVPETLARIQTQAHSDNWWLLLLFLVLWIGSVIHAGVVGRKREGP